MAILKRAISTIKDLDATIISINSAISAEVANRIAAVTAEATTRSADDATELARATGVEGALVDLTTTVKTNLVAAINSVVSGTTTAEGILRADLATEVSRAQAAESTLTANLSAEATARANAIAAEATTARAAEAALGARIDNVLDNADPSAIDSLREIVAAYQNADSNLNGAITTLAGAAGADLTVEIARATAAELVLTNNLAAETSRAQTAEASLTSALNTEINNRTTAISNLTTQAASDLAAAVATQAAADAAQTTALEAYADEAVRVGGAIDKLEAVTVANDRVVLANAPKFGLDSITLGIARFIDASVVYEAELSLDATDATGKTFIISVDSTGQWNGNTVKVQYSYTPAV